jgi:hypothetical protein
LCGALARASRQAVAAAGPAGRGAGARVVVDVPSHRLTAVELDGRAVELVQGLRAVRALDRAALVRAIDDGAAYLRRMIDGAEHGVHKRYDPTADRFEPELHTVYTASTILTLLKLRAWRGDPALPDGMVEAARFLLGMQDPGGGFFYAYDLERRQADRTLQVGTTSKTIFTLLELHAATRDRRYLDSAVAAADWLLTMQRRDGSIRSAPGNDRESLLYTGQALSALARIHRVTGERKYLDAAAQTSAWLMTRVRRDGCHLGDDYREPNPISSSWVVLSLLDFVRATGDEQIELEVYRCADDLLARQWRDAADVYRYGRWKGSLSSSGTGWLAEVTSEVYLQCRAEGRERCERFRDAVVAAARALAQYTWTAETAFLARNPTRAAGGVAWSAEERYVRTDSVCHALNAYLNIVDHVGEGTLLSIPEPPLAKQ